MQKKTEPSTLPQLLTLHESAQILKISPELKTGKKERTQSSLRLNQPLRSLTVRTIFWTRF